MARELRPRDHVIVIVGANGDLAKRKLLPSFYKLHAEGLMPAQWRLIGDSRSDMADDEFRQLARDAIEEFGGCAIDAEAWAEFSKRLSYSNGDFKPGETTGLTEAVAEAEQAIGGQRERLVYLSVPPLAFSELTLGLGESGLAERAKIVYEKPFGWDLESFCELDQTVHGVLREDQIYRIDHFLGKETVQNVLALRFANGMFEPVWNRQHIDHVQVDVPETLGIGTRAGFYEQTGALRDMVVTHLFQVLSVIAMDPPTSLASKPLMDEKAKVFESMTPLRAQDVVYGQYEGYRDAQGVAPDSQTETFVACKLEVDNWRWADVPFYLRTGKRLAESRQTVTLAFREPPRQMFPDVPRNRLSNDHLTLDLASTTEGLSISFLAKRPGPDVRLGQARMRYSYEGSFGSDLIGPYERLLYDALLGDRALFTRADGVQRTWELVQGLLDEPPPLHPYPQGSWGPDKAQDLVAPRRWHLPE